MEPQYIKDFVSLPGINRLLAEVPWLSMTPTRSECFMSENTVNYTYGRGLGVRTYSSIPYCAGVGDVLWMVNDYLDTMGIKPLNVCFLNHYANEQQHLGWHADDHAGTDHTRPIVVVSFGAEREIWWRQNEFTTNEKQKLENGSLFMMPAGFQSDHQHRIPKGDRKMGPRVSLTFRAFKG